MYLQKNIECIEKYQPHIYEKLAYYSQNSVKTDRVQIVADKDKKPVNILVKTDNEDFLLQRDSTGWVDELNPIQPIEILYGMALGTHIKEGIKKYPDKKWIIIEDDIEIFFNTLYVADITEIIKNCTILLDEPYEIFQTLFLNLFWDVNNLGMFNVRCYSIYEYILGKEWEYFDACFDKTLTNTKVDAVTRKNLIETWIYNYYTNSKVMNEASNMSNLIGQFKGIPAVIVSAGSSLEKNMHLLKELKGKCLVIAASSARMILKQNNITPDLFISTDASEGEEKIVECDTKGKDILVYANQILPKSLELWEGKKFWINYSSDFYTKRTLKDIGEDIKEIDSAPSVANTAFDLVCKLGCNPITLIGQDLAYTDNRHYAGDLEHDSLKNQEFDSSKYTKLKDIYGNNAYTTTSFLAMRNNFESTIKSHGKLVYNCTEGGISIDGAENRKFADMLDELKADINVSDKLKKLHRQNKISDEMQEKINNHNKKVLMHLKIMQGQLEEQESKIKELKNTNVRKSNKISKLCNRIDTLSRSYCNDYSFKILLNYVVQIDFYFINIKYNRAKHEKVTEYQKLNSYIETIDQQNKIMIKQVNKIIKIFEGLNK